MRALLFAAFLLASVLTGCHKGRDRSKEPCGGVDLLPRPDDVALAGPWPVGARTVRAGELVLEVWYPARVGSERGRGTLRYDLREAMPADEAAKIPDGDNVWLESAAFRDLPLDDTHGPYPVVLFLHGAASFRAQSAFLATHWASRGFVVIAPDLPGVGLGDVLRGTTSFPMGVPSTVFELITRPPPEPDPLAFVRARIAPRIGVVGHSLGAVLSGTLGNRPELAVRIAMAGTAAPDGDASTTIVVGDRDGIAPPPAGPPVPGTRLAIVHGAGHLGFTDLCLVGADRGGALAIARARGVNVPEMIATLATDGCRPADAPFAATAPVIRAVTAAALEERLHCGRDANQVLGGRAGLTWIDERAR
ncbi:MAG: hypothetical protein SFX73_13280 [Kofleriaceae bacterium]|nr:hypothetical protein [Kofleriaceae bacterium]